MSRTLQEKIKRYNKQTRTYILILLFSLCVTAVIAIVIGNETDEYLTDEINQKIINNAENNANKIEKKLNHMTGLVDAIVANVVSDYDPHEMAGSAKDEKVREFVDREGILLENCLKKTVYAHSLYIVMNPDLTEYPVETWFKRDEKGNIQELFVDPGKKKTDFANEESESMQYYFKARDKKDVGVWTGIYYDDDINENVMSYSRAIYINGQFVGVAGADILATETDYLIRHIKLYKNGTAAMFDAEYAYAISPEMDEDSSEALSEAMKQKAKNGSGLFTYTAQGRSYVVGYARMDNGGAVAIVQPEAEAYAPASNAMAIVLSIASMVGMLIFIFMYIYMQHFIKREEFLERENRQKDILLAYESRRARVGEMVGNVAHQWKQPLHTINLILANLIDSYRYDEFDEETLQNSVRKVKDITAKMSETISDFSSFMKPVGGTTLDFNLVECIDAALALMEEDLAKNRVEVIMKDREEVFVHGLPNEMRHALFNVLDNARDSVVESRKSNRRIRIDIERKEGDVYLRVADNGAGVPEYLKDKVFEPYFTTKTGEGTGLGLYIAKNVIETRMGGKISLEDAADGACCLIILKEQTNTIHKSR